MKKKILKRMYLQQFLLVFCSLSVCLGVWLSPENDRLTNRQVIQLVRHEFSKPLLLVNARLYKEAHCACSKHKEA